jgi:hypothetical protein
MQASRPGVLTAAALLLGLVSLLKFGVLLREQPLPIEVIAILLGLIGLVAVYGLWKAKRWGMIVALIVSLLNVLAAAPSFVVQPSPPVVVIGSVMLAISVLIIVLILLPSARRAYA